LSGSTKESDRTMAISHQNWQTAAEYCKSAMFQVVLRVQKCKYCNVPEIPAMQDWKAHGVFSIKGRCKALYNSTWSNILAHIFKKLSLNAWKNWGHSSNRLCHSNRNSYIKCISIFSSKTFLFRLSYLHILCYMKNFVHIY
jgi:hypothetical protein